MKQYCVLKVNDNQYIISTVGYEDFTLQKVENAYCEDARARHKVSSSSGYAVYEISGKNADKLVKQVSTYLD